MALVTFYALKPRGLQHLSLNWLHQLEKNELYLGPNVRLSGLKGMAHIETESLANEFAEACTQRFQERKQPDVQISVVRCESSPDKALLKRIKSDSEIIKKRLATGNFSPNKAP